MSEGLLLAIIMGFSILGLVAAFALAKWVLKQDAGTAAMQKISNAIKQGAEAFLKRQFTTIGMLAAAFAIVLFIGYGFIRKSLPGIDPVDSRVVLAGWITVSFVFGAICSLIAGYTGMWVSIRSNIRTAAGSIRSVNDGLQVALRGGAVSGLMVVAMSLLGVAGLYAAVKYISNVEATKIPLLIVGYGFGARSWRSSPSSAAESTPRPRTWARTWSAKLKPASPRTTPATPR